MSTPEPEPTMSPTPKPISLVGITGLTGSAALASLLSAPAPFAVTAFSRRAAPATSHTPGTTYRNVVGELAPTPAHVGTAGGIFVSCLGTTRADVGGVEKQRAIDLDMNRDLAQQARKDGAETMMLVSTEGANSSSWFAYPKMKGELEDAVKEMGFGRTIILRPGMLLYDGDRHVKRTSESIYVSMIKGLRAVGVPTTSLAVDAEDVGAAIAQLAMHPPPEGVTQLRNAELIKLASEFRAAQNKARQA
ncbi:hypothetical protein CspeluHIS016_0400450 [Cutaneotrichosporon spelunceum]|uniref:NAD(P)-binding domain-containing protein n=1 Tax=Cutaneotrichosporon spelunceum TaxID=1672016 RepID=A0AAD3TVB6_9TREE|nr:hypothetical protein CspeluHIS016_0400450 [Cutaneotrichosporon spelunceum]